MFEKYGEFDSYEEINRAAAAQLEEGDTEAIYAIAEENGIDREDAEEYIDGRYGKEGVWYSITPEGRLVEVPGDED